MKLYYSPGACSLSPHIVLRELGCDFALERVDTTTKKTETGQNFLSINSKGYVPALQLDNGEVLTEGAAIVQYLADARPDAGLVPAPGTIERARLQEQLNFIASELHKAFSPLFGGKDSEKPAAIDRVALKLDQVEATLADGRPYLLGDDFTVADAYLFVVSGWTRPTGIGLDRWPNLRAHHQRIAARPNVQAALRAEGLN